MKSQSSRWRLLSGLGAVLLVSLSARAQSQTASAPSAPAPAPAVAAPLKLPYGVADIIKLSRAQVSEDIIVKYIQNSGTIYTLGPQEIVYLRDQGVSDRVVHVMLDQRKNATEVAAQAAAPATVSPTPQVAPVYNEPAPAYLEAPPPEVQPAASYVPPSTVYVIPYPQARYAYYGYPRAYYYPYYGYGGYYGGYWGPSISLGFGFGRGAHYHHYHR